MILSVVVITICFNYKWYNIFYVNGYVVYNTFCFHIDA